MKLVLAVILAGIVSSTASFAEEVIFEDNFDKGVSPEWKFVGMSKDDYRHKDGGLEIRVGNKEGKRRMVLIEAPITNHDTVIASVQLTLLDKFARSEIAGLTYVDDDGPHFSANKRNLDGHIVFSPPYVEHDAKAGGAGDPENYTLRFTPVSKGAGPLRIILRGSHAFFQVGPSTKQKYMNFFHSAVSDVKERRGFCLMASGAPEGKTHWVRFDNFKIVGH